MPRIEPVTIDNAAPKARRLLEDVEATLGFTPNLFRTFAHSPAVLDAYLGLNRTLRATSLTAAQRESIALTVAGINGCDYCASAHTAAGAATGLDRGELAANLAGTSDDAKTRALVTFAAAIVRRQGWVEDADLDAARAAGLTDAELTEVILTTAVNIFTNYFNHVAGTEVDFPYVASRPQAAAE